MLTFFKFMLAPRTPREQVVYLLQAGLSMSQVVQLQQGRTLDLKTRRETVVRLGGEGGDLSQAVDAVRQARRQGLWLA